MGDPIVDAVEVKARRLLYMATCATLGLVRPSGALVVWAGVGAAVMILPSVAVVAAQWSDRRGPE